MEDACDRGAQPPRVQRRLRDLSLLSPTLCFVGVLPPSLPPSLPLHRNLMVCARKAPEGPRMQTDVAVAVAESMPTPSVKESTPLHSCEPTAPPQWISHLEGRTLVEGTAEAFRHPCPGKPDPIATLLNLSDVGLEHLCGGFMRRIYPEGEYSPDERERMRDAFHRRFVDGRHDAYAQFRSEVAELQAVSAAEAMQMYASWTRALLPKAWRTLRARRTVGPVDPAPRVCRPHCSQPGRPCTSCC